VRRVALPWKKPGPTVCDFAGRGFYPGTVTREHAVRACSWSPAGVVSKLVDPGTCGREPARAGSGRRSPAADRLLNFPTVMVGFVQ
jgi:hypothetical protein